MRIERVDDKTVKCFLSNEELEEYDIDYKDFVMRSEKAKEVVQEIIEQAEEEVGYKPPQFAFDLQIMLLPDQGMVLTFSEKEPVDLKDGGQILECLKDMSQILQKTKDKLIAAGGKTPTAAEGQKKQTSKSRTSKTEAPQSESANQETPARPNEAVFVFDRITSVMSYAAVLPANLRINSALYQMEDSFYLHLQKGAASYERYSRACVQAMEFGNLYTAEADRLLHLKEHGECLIAERALKKLR